MWLLNQLDGFLRYHCATDTHLGGELSAYKMAKQLLPKLSQLGHLFSQTRVQLEKTLTKWIDQILRLGRKEHKKLPKPKKTVLEKIAKMQG